jgi:protocatechuate 3,4-dioxygenase beta subunit
MRTDSARAILLVVLWLLPQSGAAQNKAAEREVRMHPLSVSGRALDEAGKPVQGAIIFLVSTNSSPQKTLGQATSDANGRYEFRDAPLPESRRSKPAEQYQSGCFQVFGKASGRGFAWRGMKFFYVNPSAAQLDPEKRDAYRKDGFFATDNIELDLTFPAKKRIYGRFVDEAGKPIAGVKLQLGKCDYVNPAGKEDHVNFREFWAAWQAAEVMPDQLLATSDSDGRFEFESVPAEIFSWLIVEHPDYASFSIFTTTADAAPATHNGRQVLKSPLETTLYSTKKTPVLVQLADTKQPIAGVNVSATQQGYTGYESRATSDEEGKLTLKLPPGRYNLEGSPPKELDYIRTTQDLVVHASPAEQPITLGINPGCVLVLVAIDADTRAGIPNVTFWYEMTELPNGRPGRGRTSVQSHTTGVDNPKSNADGELRAVVIPGSRHYGVGFNPLPDGYEIVEPSDRFPGRLLNLPAGGTIRAEFILRKAGK